MSDQQPVHRSLQNQISPAGLLTYSVFWNLPIVVTVVYLQKLVRQRRTEITAAGTVADFPLKTKGHGIPI